MTVTSEFEEFCGGTFWNSSLTWGNVAWPEFTHCFQHTLLVWVPCLFLWLTLPANLYYMYKNRSYPIALTKRAIVKMVISSALVILGVAEIIMASGSRSIYGDSIPDTLYVTPAIKTASMILTIGLFYLELQFGFITSGVQFVYWLLFLLFSIVPFYTKIFYVQDEKLDYDSSIGPMVVFYIEFTLIFIQLLLQIKAEVLPPQAYTHTNKPPCPEILASFFSRITFWWMNRVVTTGYKKSLVESDLWDLNPRDKSHATVPVFEKAWMKQVNIAKRENEMKEARSALSQNKKVPSKVTEKSPLLDQVQYKPESYKCGSTQPKRTPSIAKAMMFIYGPTLLKAVALKFIYDCMMFVNPQILSLLIEFTEDRTIQEWKGYVYIVAMFANALTQSLLFHQSLHIGMTLGMRMRAAFIAAIYRKSLLMNSEARKTSTVGEIVNLMSVDAQRIQDIMSFLWTLFSCPVLIILSMVFLYLTLGPSVFAGLAVMILIMPINAAIAIAMKKLQVKQMKLKDDRIKLMNEVLNGMKVLKLYAWEKLFEEKVTDIRGREMHLLNKLAYLSAFSTFTWMIAPFIVTLATFVTYTLTSESHYLDANKAFVALSLFNIIRSPITMLPMIISLAVQANVSVTRISKFLQTGELSGDSVTHDNSAENMLSIKNGTFSWEKDDPPILKDINIEVPQGQLLAVVGPVGAGKSSLISAFLGEMEKIKGSVNIKGSLAYVPQTAWIQNATLRDNILFGSRFNAKDYDHVIDCCALRPDLAILAGGDLTEIGEKGINLSGGQKQRVSLARAVYNDAEIYILDDPLSAVDSHVGKHLFEQVIGNKGILKNKTRVLITHGVHWLPLVDTVVVMDDGRITEMGSYEDLMQHDGAFAKFIHTYLTIDLEEEEDEPEEIREVKAEMLHRAETIREDYDSFSHESIKEQIQSQRMSRVRDLETSADLERSLRKSISKSREHRRMTVESEKELIDKQKLIEEEKAETGQVSFLVYAAYAKAIGPLSSVIIIMSYVLFNVSQAFANVWLSSWSESDVLRNASIKHYGVYHPLNDFFMGVYGGLGACQAVFILIYSTVFSIRQVHAATKLHHKMLQNIFRNPMSFFDTTPIGRIVNRFSRDIETIDNNLPVIIRQFFYTMFNVITTIIVISATTPLFIAVIIPLMVIYYLIQRYYIPTSRQLKRIESTSRSPIYNHFTETILGASSIRAYDVVDRFQTESDKRVDNNLIYYFAGVASNRWLGIRLEFVGNILIVAASLFAVIGRSTLSGGLVGLSISYALQVTQSLNWMVRMTSDMETNVVSVERVKEYTETPTEAAWVIEETKPPSNWPDTGRIEFRNYSTRYRPGLDLVLKGISGHVRGGEKVGIVGRTGAGKSSLTLALFRLIESANGQIIIDGKVVADLGLHDLRSRLTILPQDPVLFSGTLRMNLDPFNQYNDEQVWRALETSNLKAFVAALPDQLQHECGEGGSNLSLGQRQLICLARTLLKKTKILVLDEATSAVDMETDDLIQQAIASEFSECTVVTIAHRLNTIMDYDRVMVMDEGNIIEFDTPAHLLDDDTTVFYGMARDSGLVH